MKSLDLKICLVIILAFSTFGLYAINVATPTFNPAPGYYTTAVSCTISCATPSAQIRYTIDGNTPNIHSSVYSAPLQIPLNTIRTVKAIAFLLPDSSAVATAVYTVTGQVSISPPVFTPVAGLYQTAQTLLIGTPVPSDATVRYTNDGSDPIASSPVFPAAGLALGLNNVHNIKVKAFKTSWTPSPTYSAIYTITGQVAITAPQFNPLAGTYQTAQTITINNPIPSDAAIRYTTDGTEPTTLSPEFPASGLSLALADTHTIKVIAFKNNWTPSITYTAVYIMTGQVNIPTPVFSPAQGTYQTAQTLMLSSPIPADATVRYTTNGSDPTASSTVFPTSGLALNLETNYNIKVKAYKTNWTPSPVYSATYTITGQVSITAPVFTPAQGTYQTVQTVTLGTVYPAGATRRYTTDGTNPTSSSPVFPTAGLPLSLDSSTTLKVKCFYTDWDDSPVYTAIYTITGTVAMNYPVFSPAPGSYYMPINVSLGSTYPTGSTIKYTTNGQDPVPSSASYSGPITLPLNQTTTVKIRAYKTDWTPSLILSGTYYVGTQVSLSTAVFNPSPGYYSGPQSVVVNCSSFPPDAEIHYTLDNSEPTVNSPLLSGAVYIAGTSTVKLKGFKENWTPSATQSAVYTITGQVEMPDLVFTPAPGVFQTVTSIAINNAVTPGTTRRYTLDGSEPTENSPIYNNPIQLGLDSVTTIRVRAYRANWLPSEVYSGTFTVTGQVSLPEVLYSPVPGIYDQTQSVFLNTATYPSGAILRYTTDGSDPSSVSPEYQTPIELGINSTTTIKVAAFKDDWLQSMIASATYTITGQVLMPPTVFDPAPGAYQIPTNIIIASALTSGASLRYTLDGSEPSENSPIYNNPIQLGLDTVTTIKVRAYRANWLPSEVYSGTFTITGQVYLPEVVFSPAPGLYQHAQSVFLNTATSPSGAVIRYTIDGSDPTDSSQLYQNPIELGLNTVTTIKVAAFRNGWINSEIRSAIFTITNQVQVASQPFSPAPGIYQAPVIVSVSGSDPVDAVFHYTIDGTDPDVNSPLYSIPLSIEANKTTTIKLRAFKTEWTPSEVVTGIYLITGQVSLPAAPLYPQAGVYQDPQMVFINSLTDPPGADIRYTLDGTTPTQSSSLYSSPIQISDNCTIKICAFAENWTPSSTYTADYTIVNYPADILLNQLIEFNGTKNKHYRLVGMPGAMYNPIAWYLNGDAEYDWKVFAETGSIDPEEHLLEWNEENNLAFRPGTAYWILSKEPLLINSQVGSVPLDVDMAYTIPIHAGWNIISNPFLKTIPWSEVKLLNSIHSEIWNFVEGEFIDADVLEPGKGYYFENNDPSATGLRIPFYWSSASVKDDIESLQISLDRRNGDPGPSICLGISEAASDQEDGLDQKAPPLDFCETSIHTEGSILVRDYRRNSDQIFDFIIDYPEDSPRVLRFSGTMPGSALCLWDKSDDSFTAVHPGLDYALEPNHNRFALVCGSPEFLNGIRETTVPELIYLGSNRPNPFSSFTNLKAGFTSEVTASVCLYNIKGQLVMKLATDKAYQAGVTEWIIDGSSLASGIYFCRIDWKTGDSRGSKTIKMLKLK